jgi:hypothetical protein
MLLATNASVLPSEKDVIGCAPIITKALAHMSIFVVAIIIKKNDLGDFSPKSN